MVGQKSPMSESTSPARQAELKESNRSPRAQHQVKVTLALDHLFATLEEALSIEEPMEVDLVSSRKLDDPMDGGVSKMGREPAATGNTGSRITPAEVPPSAAEKSNVPSEVPVKKSICSSAVCTSATRHARRRSLKPIIDV